MMTPNTINRYDLILHNRGRTVHQQSVWRETDKQALAFGLLVAAVKLPATQDRLRYSVQNQIVTVDLED